MEYENHSNLVNQARSEAEKCIQMIKNRIEYIKSTEEEKYFKWKEELSDFCDRMKKIEVKLYRVSTFDNEKNREVVKKELNDLLERVPLTPEEERKRREEEERKRREEEDICASDIYFATSTIKLFTQARKSIRRMLNGHFHDTNDNCNTNGDKNNYYSQSRCQFL